MNDARPLSPLRHENQQSRFREACKRIFLSKSVYCARLSRQVKRHGQCRSTGGIRLCEISSLLRHSLQVPYGDRKVRLCMLALTGGSSMKKSEDVYTFPTLITTAKKKKKCRSTGL